MQSKMQSLAQQLIECNGKLQELEERHRIEREPYEQAKQVIREQLLGVMTKNNTLSTRFADFTIARKKSVRATVMNEFTAVQALKQTRPDLVLESVSPEALKAVEKGSLTLDGVTVQSKEYVAITKAKEKEQSLNK